jgi:hypothetical protein
MLNFVALENNFAAIKVNDIYELFNKTASNKHIS